MGQLYNRRVLSEPVWTQPSSYGTLQAAWKGNSGQCTGRVVLKQGNRVRGRAPFSLRRETACTVAVALPPRARRSLARHGTLPVRALGVTTHLSGNRTRTGRRLTLRA